MRRSVAGVGIAAVFVAGIGLGAVIAGGPDSPTDDGSDDRADSRGESWLDDVELAALSGFDECDEYLSFVKERALEQATPYGLGGHERAMETDDAEGEGMAGADTAADADGAASTPAAGTTPDDVSGTNVQEHGVDEPDRLKTDGEVVYTTIGGRLRVLDITGDEPVEIATVELRDHWGAELLLAGDRLLVASGGGPVIPFADESVSSDAAWPEYGGMTTTLTAIDVSDPSEPVVEERLVLDGATLSSRMVDGVARVVIRTEPGINLPWAHPEGGGIRAERDALEENRRLIRESEAADWLPYYVHQTADGQEHEGLLLGCEQVARPERFAGLGTLSVLTIDVTRGELVPDDGGVGVIAGGDTVYASTERLYVATQRYVDPQVLEEAARDGERPEGVDDVTTEIHAFDIGDPTGTRYLASGEVPGVLLDQWALSEHEGVLRVASTVGDRWWSGTEDSSSLVTTLERDGGELVEMDQVGDLGPTERIFAVRFLGELGYVVTFRQTDPLYVLDLSDPTDLRVTGELKIPGYSGYLHPLGDGRLLGVGQDADEQTGETHGTQVSLFDVNDPTDPQRVDTITVSDSNSDVEHDHRAFLHWPATGLNVVPVTRWWYGEGELPPGPPNGALAFRVSDDRFEPIGDHAVDELVLTHVDEADLRDATDGEPAGEDLGRPDDAAIMAWEKQYDATIQRSVVVGDRLLTFSERGVRTHHLDDLSTIAELRY